MCVSLCLIQENIVFASVHDCFWTHAGSIVRMNAILREQFLNLYTPRGDISGRNSSQHSKLYTLLERLRGEICKVYGLNIVPVRGMVKHIQRQKHLKYPQHFCEKDWRPIQIPPLPLTNLEIRSTDDDAKVLNITDVLKSTYFFH